MTKFSELGIKITSKNFIGDKIKISKILNKEISVLDFTIGPSKNKDWKECLKLQLEIDGDKRISFTSGKYLIEVIQQIEKSKFPIVTRIIEKDETYYFS